MAATGPGWAGWQAGWPASTTVVAVALSSDALSGTDPNTAPYLPATVAEALTGAADRIDHKYAQLSPAVRGHLHAAMQQALAELSRSSEAVQAGRRAVAALAEAAATSSM